MSAIIRPWITPALAVAFLAMAATGTLMLLHVKSSMIKELHERIGLVFIGVALTHIVLNWRPLSAYFRQKTSIIAALIALALVAVLALAEEDEKEDHHREGQKELREHHD